jgi:hypothetical protein
MANAGIMKKDTPLQEWLPTRFCSSDEKDPGFANWQEAQIRGLTVHTYLDGVEQEMVDMVDSLEGCFRRCKVDADGNICVDGDEIVTEIVRGAVEIVLKGAS